MFAEVDMEFDPYIPLDSIIDIRSNSSEVKQQYTFITSKMVGAADMKL